MIKIKVHPLTYFILFSILICGYFNYFLIISFILLIHDLGHIIVMRIFNIKIYNLTILPFGSIIKSNIKYNLNSNIQLLISISGILMQLMLYFIFKFLFELGFVNDISLSIFNYYNKLIILFNVLPIIPLDGSKVLLSFLERIFPFKLSLKIVNIISLVFIVIFILLNKVNLNLILMFTFLLLKTYEEILNHNYIFNKFLLERYLAKTNNYKIKYIKSINNIYKNRFNFIKNESESRFLAKLFDIESYF